MTNTTHQSNTHRIALSLTCGFALWCMQGIALAACADDAACQAAIVGGAVGTAAGTAGSAALVAGSGFTGLAGIGAMIGGGVVTGTVALIALPAVGAVAVGAGVYGIVSWLSD